MVFAYAFACLVSPPAYYCAERPTLFDCPGKGGLGMVLTPDCAQIGSKCIEDGVSIHKKIVRSILEISDLLKTLIESE
jgi:hypothetical protein